MQFSLNYQEKISEFILLLLSNNDYWIYNTREKQHIAHEISERLPCVDLCPDTLIRLRRMQVNVPVAVNGLPRSNRRYMRSYYEVLAYL